MAKSPNWSQEEIDFLREFYPNNGIRWCAERLPLRTEGAVNCEACILGIKRNDDRGFTDYFKNIDTEDKAYWLGFLFADGCVGDIKVSLSQSERYVVDDFQKSIGCNYKVRTVYGKEHAFRDGKIYTSKTHYCVEIPSVDMANDLRRHGCVNKKSLVLEYPDHLNEHLRHHFARGYFDGDGCIHGGMFNEHIVVAGTQNFIEAIAKSCEILSKYSIHKQGNIHTCHISSVQAMNFMEWMYSGATIFLKRKKDKYDALVSSRENSKEGKWCRHY